MKKIMAMIMAALAAAGAFGYEISLGTFVSNAGKTVTVPVAIDSVAGLSYASVSVTYDPQVLVCLTGSASRGTLRNLIDSDENAFTVVDTNGTVTVSVFAATNLTAGAGTLANLVFAVREGTEGLYSDLAVTSAEIGEASGVKDITVESPLVTKNGMIRVMATSASVSRLENAETICAETTLASLALESGDKLQAGDDQTKGATITSVTADAAIVVAEPVAGWASGTYTLLTSKTTDLTFTLEYDGEVTYSSSVADGLTTYYAAIAVDGEKTVALDSSDDSGEVLSSGTQNTIRSLVETADAAKYAAASKFVVKAEGDAKGNVGIIADMGISPALAAVDATGTLTLTYSMPKLEIIDFDPEAQTVRIKVTPGTGNTIVNNINTGYVHVYGTDTLGASMKLLTTTGFDLTQYLKAETKGEAQLSINMGTHTFLKVKVESVTKAVGEAE